MTFSVQLQRKRLLLGPLRARDAWFFYRLIGNPGVRKYLGGPVGRSQRLRQFKRYLNAPAHVGIWVVRLAKGGQPVGIIELGPHKDGDAYEVSYQFAPAVWGQGYAREALEAIVSHALDDVGLDRVVAETQSANIASCKVLQSGGMVEIERLRRFGAEQIIFSTP